MTIFFIILFILTAPLWSALVDVAFKLLFGTAKFGVGLVCAAGSKDGEETGPASFKKFANGILVLTTILGIVLAAIVFILNRIS